MKKKILIVDDNKGDQRLIEEYLKDAGFEFDLIKADSGESGLVKAKEESPDIAIVDTKLPGIDGFETCSAIKSLAPEIKAVIFTGIVDAVDGKKAREAGADGYCVKTADYEDLIHCLRDLMNEEGATSE